MSSLTVEEEEQTWVPTHVQVTVLRGRGLRGKGKHGTSDVYAIIQLGKEKYSTGVAEKTTEPEWREECSFELQPGVLQGGGRSGYPAGGSELVLTVMHRALMGLDVFLGQAVVQLDEVFNQSRWVKNQWYRLNSKTGKKEKERGDIQVSVQFTRNNLTASMYDLVMKDKGTSTFNKLKERMRGKRRSSEEDSSSAVVPGGNGSGSRVRTRLPSDGGGEEDYEDDEGGEARRSKMRTFFLRGKLRKSSDTRSSTSLGSESSESSRGGSLSPTAGISVVVSDLSNSPSNSSNLTADYSPEHTENTSPKSSSLRCDSGDEAGEITIAVPQLTVNGSHAYKVQPLDPGSGKPVDSLGLGLLQKSLPVSVSLQNLSPRASADPHKAPGGDGRRWSFDKPGEEEKAAIAAALEQSGPMQGEEEEEEEEERLGRAALSESQGKKQRGKGSKDGAEGAPAATPEKHKGWFGSKDSHCKPSLVVSPKLDPNTDPLPSSHPPSGPPVDLTSLVSPLHPTNPFCRSETSPPPISPCNPFFSVRKHNPFYDDMLTTQDPTPTLPPLPYLSSSRPPIAQLFPPASNPSHTVTCDNPATEDSVVGTDVATGDGMAEVEKGLLPLAPTDGENPLSKELSNPLMSAGQLESEWDECFEEFAAGRLQSPEDLSTDCKTQQNTPSDHPLENCNNKETLLPITDRNTSESDALHHHPCTTDPSDAQEATDAFAHLLETIPEQIMSESDNTTLNPPPDLSKLDACTDTNQASSTTNTNMHQTPCNTSSTQLISSSPDPASSGLGSSVEDDIHSGLSSYADRLSASSSSEESEARNFESNIQHPDAALSENQKPSESVDDITDRSNDWTVLEVAQETVVQQQDGDGGPDNSEAPQSPVIPHQESEITARESDTKGEETETLNLHDVPDLLPNVSEVQLESNNSSQSDVFKSLILDFSEEFKDSSGNNNTDVNILVTPDDEFSSKLPSLYVLTSSPDLKQRLLDTSLGRPEASRSSPVSFGAFGETRPGLDFDSTLLHTQVSDQSSSSFLQSLYVSTDSQDYQTCVSHSSSSVSELDETPLSANSTLCGELSDIQTPADAALGLEESTGASSSSSRKVNQTNRFEEYDDKTKFMMGEDFDLEVLPAALTDSEESCGPKRLGEENQTDDEFSRSAVLHRSHSEGTLTPGFDELLLPSFGSDPGAIQESLSVPPDLALPSLTSFAPSLMLSSSSLVLRSFPPLALAGSPPSTAQAAEPEETQEQQQQQAASQQNSPHPVRPLTTAMLAEEKRTEGRSVLATGLEKLKSTIHPGRSSQVSEAETDRRKAQSLTEGAGSYYHLTHSELVALLGQREADLRRQGAEFERQRVLLAKRELELRRLKPQVRDLEDYIDTLLVRIMEQKPTLLQVGSKLK
ncbi:rab11 family-interacting protein 1 [Pleuronectes platessa]|uniref:rab11 family-interacting protein 1 n=1 Tax=Pleuronectes platessa TaxID=8262 RepID=UPI00232A5400|nr:rab11 family-interacting protein 1 [Pleuronectes platessa]